MDFTGRSSQPAQPAGPAPQYANSAAGGASKKNSKSQKPRWQAWGVGVLGLVTLALVVALLIAIGFGGPKAESSYINRNELQAVFLNTGQVYFGNVKSLNGKYLVLDNIYYLQTSNSGSSTNSSSPNTNVSLVKLGCELHAPDDQMVINRDQVTFWENLKDNGQVAKAVSTFEKDHPNGQQCTDQSAAPNTNSNVQGTANNSTNGSASTGTNSTSTGSATNKQ